jgi:asparagine synthase (glutamine-hydrolysing)
MSGFFGVFSPGGNVDRLAFDQMQKTILREGYDELETHVDDRIAMGHLMLRVTPESTYDKQPLNSSCGRYLLVGHFRLDYRDELADKLGLTQKELDVTPDSVLAMLSYQKWADKCVHHIEGDWAFVLHDRIQNSLTCFKDKYGTSALFYGKNGDSFYFASSTNVFTSISQYFSDVDLHQLYRLSISGLSFEKNRTLLKNVFRLSPCSYLKISSTFDQVIVTYFVFSKKKKIRFNDELDYIFELRSLFSNAVKNKIRGVRKLGTFQSSGLDSNSVLYFIAKEFEYINLVVNTYTSCNAYLDEINEKYYPFISDQLMYKESLQQYKNINAQFLPFREVDFNKEFQESFSDFNNPVVTKSKFWVKGIIRKARLDGVMMMVTGQLGNFTITWNKPNALISDLIHLHFYSTIEQLFKIANRTKRSFIRIAWIHLVKPVIHFIGNQVSIRLGSKRNKIEKESIFFHPLDRKVNWGHIFKESLSPVKTQLLLLDSDLQKASLEINAEVTGERWYCEGDRNGIIVTDPTIDIRLVDFLFNIPSKYFYFNGEQKYLFRKAFKGRIFEPLLSSNYTIHQSFDLFRRILKDPFFFNFIESLNGDQKNHKIIDVQSIVDRYHALNTDISESNKYINAVKLLSDLSIVYLYNKIRSAGKD